MSVRGSLASVEVQLPCLKLPTISCSTSVALVLRTKQVAGLCMYRLY